MNHNHRPTIGIGLAVVWALALPTQARGGEEPCRRTTFRYAEVKKACKKGGQDAVKRLMKKAVMRAKDDGKDWKCSTCHENQKTYESTDEAEELDISRYF